MIHHISRSAALALTRELFQLVDELESGIEATLWSEANETAARIATTARRLGEYTAYQLDGAKRFPELHPESHPGAVYSDLPLPDLGGES